MSLIIGDNFSYLGKKPLDNRIVVDTITDLVAIVDNTIYDGILVYVTDEQKYYTYNSNNNIDVTLGKWRELTTSIAKKVSKVLQYTQDTDFDKDVLVYIGNKISRVDVDYKSDNTQSTVEDSYDLDITNGKLIPVSAEDLDSVLPYAQDTDFIANTLIFCDEKMARVKTNYHSDNTTGFTLQQSFEEDIKNNKISIINTDHVDILNPYAQSNMYFKNTLVFKDNLIARVLQDFIADTTASTVDDSFDIDITNGNILVLNKEAQPGIMRYKQNTFYEKDKLVYADKRIGRVLNDYISDNTGTTIEQSINIDIANGNLLEIAENYKFKLYKTTQDMNKTIDAINTLPISTIQFENGETIDNMQLHEGVYGPLGTLSIITEIDKNTNTIKTKSVSTREMEFMPPAPKDYTYTIILGGTGYVVGDIVPTSTTNVNVEVLTVGASGTILTVGPTTQETVSTSGAGCSIEANINYYVGNGKQWYELPANKKNAVIKEYQQGESYEVNNLIYLGDILARANMDFTANNTLTTVDASFKSDLDSGYITRMTREDVSVPECLGSVKTDKASDLPGTAIKGNWVLIEDCVNTSAGQAGIGLYNGTTWDILLIPQGTFTFPEPTADGKLYLRKVDVGNTSGQWEAFTEVNGNNIEVTVKTKNDITDNLYVPANGELVWDTGRNILVIGDGTTTLGSLNAFYDTSTLTSTDIITALGFTPENIANKGQANGYAPLDANGLVPTQHLPAALTDVYTKAEVDNKDTTVLNSATTLVNTESTRAQGVENTLRTDLTTHTSDNTKHVTQTEKDTWNDKLEESDITDLRNHITDTVAHVTQADKDKWNGMNKAYYVTSTSDLPSTGNQIGNMGYVQVSATGVVPVVCDQYIWDGSTWKQMDAGQISLTFTWGNLQGKPASTPLSIDNTVTVAHNHTNKTVLDKIGQSAAGNFTYDGVEIGVKVLFLANENLLPTVGEEDTLYVIYEDSRVRNYPSISVYKDNAYQILGRGTQDVAPVVGDMSILQSEYFSVVANSTYKITVTPNQYFAFMPVEILREVEGLKDQEKILIHMNNPADFEYNENMLSINSTKKLTISIQDRKTDLDTVSNFYYSHVDVDLDDFKDIDNIG